MYFSQDVSYSTSILSHMVCGKFNSHVYKLKRWVLNEHIFFDFTIWGQKRCLYWGISSVPKKFDVDLIIMIPSPKDFLKKNVRAPVN
jgi:hypothetical protein